MAIRFAQNSLMADEYPLSLRQADQARADFSAIEGDLQLVMSQLARIPTHRDLACTGLWIAGAAAGFVICWFKLFAR